MIPWGLGAINASCCCFAALSNLWSIPQFSIAQAWPLVSARSGSVLNLYEKALPLDYSIQA